MDDISSVMGHANQHLAKQGRGNDDGVRGNEIKWASSTSGFGGESGYDGGIWMGKDSAVLFHKRGKSVGEGEEVVCFCLFICFC